MFTCKKTVSTANDGGCTLVSQSEIKKFLGETDFDAISVTLESKQKGQTTSAIRLLKTATKNILNDKTTELSQQLRADLLNLSLRMHELPDPGKKLQTVGFLFTNVKKVAAGNITDDVETALQTVFLSMSHDSFSCHSDAAIEFMKTARFMLHCFKCRLLESGEDKPMTLFGYTMVAADEKQKKIRYLDDILAELNLNYHRDQNKKKQSTLADNDNSGTENHVSQQP